MLPIIAALVVLLAIATIWPELPVGKSMTRLGVKAVTALQSIELQARAVVAICAALLLYAAISTLAGDAPLFLAMMLPELAAWFATFEIMTLVEVMLGVGTAVAAARAAGVRSYVMARFRARRNRRTARAARKPANDDEPRALPLAA